MVAPSIQNLVSLVGGSLPPGLNTLLPASDLQENEVPEALGLDLSSDGFIKKGTIPSASASIEGTKSITSVRYNVAAGVEVPFKWLYRRLFNITNMTASTDSNILNIGAEGYLDAFFYERGVGPIPLNDIDIDTGAVADSVIKDLTTFGADGVLIGTTSGSYALRGFNSAGRLSGLSRSHIIEELLCTTAGSMGSLDQVAYLTNASGLMSYDGSSADHVSVKIKGTSLDGQAITVNHEDKLIVCGSTMVYDVLNEKFFQYSGSAFSFKTRVLHNPDWSPFSVDRVIFVIDRNGSDDLEITFRTKYEDEDFSDESFIVDAIYDEGLYTTISHSLEYNRAVRKFQLQVDGMDSNLKIKAILVNTENYNMDDYSA